MDALGHRMMTDHGAPRAPDFPTHASVTTAGPYRGVRVHPDEAETAKRLLAFMLRLRACEEALEAAYHPANEMRCPVHFSTGQEAVPAALSELLIADDFLFSHHRSHGYFLAKQAPMRSLTAELYGRASGANGGLAGSQDISYGEKNFFGGAILAGTTAIAAGAALAMRVRGQPHVAVAGFGESATDEGIFWETINYAAIARLPVVFVCENNKYSVFSPQLKRQAENNLAERVAAFGVRSSVVFGNDALSVYRVLSSEILRALGGEGPAFVEAITYRWSGHVGPLSDDFAGYRESAEIEAWKANCPISLLQAAMRHALAVTR